MKLSIITLLAIVFFVSPSLYGLGREHFGPAEEGQMSWSPDWPAGTQEMLKHPARVYSTWVNGFERYYYKASLEQINALLELYAKLNILDHEVWIESGRQNRNSFQGKSIDYNVFLYIPARRSTPSYLRHEDPEGLEDGWILPILKIYDDTDGQLIEELKLPDSLIVHAAIPDCPKTKTFKPQRKPYVTRFLLEDGTPVSGIGVKTRITLWQKGCQQGIALGSVGFQGIYEMYFSELEMARFQSGQAWLTVTYGNHQTVPKPTDQKVPVDVLTPHIPLSEISEEASLNAIRNRDLIGVFNTAFQHAKVLTVKPSSTDMYYGKLIFESETSIDIERFMVVLPMQGMIQVDQEGCFKAIYSKEQMDKVIKENSNGTVMIRDPDASGVHYSIKNIRFPLTILSSNQEKPGFIEIPND